MARKYAFVCDTCGGTDQADSECLPVGWVVMAVAGRSLDLCSVDCAGSALQVVKLGQMVTERSSTLLGPSVHG